MIENIEVFADSVILDSDNTVTMRQESMTVHAAKVTDLTQGYTFTETGSYKVHLQLLDETNNQPCVVY